MKNHYNLLISQDISEIDIEIRRNSRRVSTIIRAYSRSLSSFATNNTIGEDIAANDELIDKRTLSAYLNALRKLFVIEKLEVWSPALRSKSTIRTSAKRQFVDPSIAAYALVAQANDFITNLNIFVFLFERLVYRDLRIYAEILNGQLYQYRDSDRLEADAIINLHDGKWGSIEIKLGETQIDMAARNLLKLKERVNSDKMNEAKFLTVITGGTRAYKRVDGVLVVPIGCLKP